MSRNKESDSNFPILLTLYSTSQTEYPRHNQSVNWVAFGGSREPVLLATCSSDGCVKLHNTSAFSEWQDRSNLEGIRRVPRKQAARFPPRIEGMTFHRRPVSLWKFSIAQNAMDHIGTRLESDTDLKHEVTSRPLTPGDHQPRPLTLVTINLDPRP